MQNDESNDNIAYWLSNTATLLSLLQRTLKASGAAGATPRRKPPTPTTLFGRMTQVCWFIQFHQCYGNSTANCTIAAVTVLQ